ncbi:MAG: sugar ABC transporter permease [Actinomycetota bacterium]|nr:sugar ABC transporter permease [Actinomycetota bacterium]
MPRRLRRSAAPWLLLAPALAVVLVLFLGGLALGVAQSLGYLPFLDGWRWSLDGYRALTQDPAVRASLALTLRVSLLSTAAATVLGVGAALLVSRTGRARRLLTGVFTATLPVPHLVGAVAMGLVLSQSGLLSRATYAAGLTDEPADFPPLTADSFGWGIIAAFVWKEAPFIAVVVLAALTRGVTDFEDAARVLGAGGWQRQVHVVLPLIARSIAGASLLVFTFTFGSYEIPLLLGRPYPAALPVVALQSYQDPNLHARAQAMAISVGTAVLVGALVVGYLAVVDRATRRLR